MKTKKIILLIFVFIFVVSVWYTCFIYLLSFYSFIRTYFGIKNQNIIHLTLLFIGTYGISTYFVCKIWNYLSQLYFKKEEARK